MTVPRLESVGFCAHYSKVGDWAFDYALGLSRRHQLVLNVFHFLVDPYEPGKDEQRRYTPSELAQFAFERERELRFYYDERAGDFLDVGFRLCYDDSWRELHRCLAHREFQLLVLAKPAPDAYFCRKPIEAFADSYACPLVLVGPDRPDRFRINGGAALLSDRLDLPADRWERILVA
jgi:hypothetical protein